MVHFRESDSLKAEIWKTQGPGHLSCNLNSHALKQSGASNVQDRGVSVLSATEEPLLTQRLTGPLPSKERRKVVCSHRKEDLQIGQDGEDTAH